MRGMTIDGWLRGAVTDVEARGLAAVRPLLESLAPALARLRDADWNVTADTPAPPPAGTAATGAGAVAEHPATPREAHIDSSVPAAPPSIRETLRRLRAREVSASELLRESLSAIDRRSEALNAFITVTRESAEAQARAADEALARGGDTAPLLGLPLSLKDLIDVAGMPTTAASRVRHGVLATRDATVTARLKAAGAVILGKCNLHEFAFGTTSEESAYGAVRHPLDPSRSPGGSSGGSAVAVLTGMCAASIGTDTGGSVRIPAAACGLVGLKPTAGGVPIDGVVALAASLDHVGPITRTVDDASILFDVLRGYGHFTREPIGHGLAPSTLRLGVPRRYFCDLLDDDVRTAFDAALDRLRQTGATIDDVDIPHAPLTAPVYLAAALPEIAAYHARTLETRPDDYTRPVRLRLEMSRYVPAEDYVRAQAGRAVLRAEVDAALSGRHALLLPALAIVAPAIGEPTVRVGSSVESVRNVMLRLTQLFNLTGHPAVSVPCGLSPAGLPIGAQLVGRCLRTRDLLRVAGSCEPVLRG
jgi:aspartyl-tRNA(Asn)/glutamyl-tRNA(Gln) amidotransferase subunit A